MHIIPVSPHHNLLVKRNADGILIPDFLKLGINFLAFAGVDIFDTGIAQTVNFVVLQAHEFAVISI